MMGAVCLAGCILAGRRRMLPWQWLEGGTAVQVGNPAAMDGASLSIRSRRGGFYGAGYGTLEVGGAQAAAVPGAGAGAQRAGAQQVQEYR